MVNNHWLVVTGTMEFYDFPYIGNAIIPTDELIFFRGVQTTNQIIFTLKKRHQSFLGHTPFSDNNIRD